jgi:hypothetical protein
MDSDDFNEQEFLDSLENDNNLNFGDNTYTNPFQENPSDMNLVEWQLDFSKDLDDIRKFLSGYREGYDERGNYTLVPPKEDEEVPFNEYGVNVLMGHIRCYLNRNTVLSNYEEKRIKKILFDLGNILGDEIEQTYEILGMDTDYKKRKFKMIILNTLHMVESAYLRALRGGERESLRKNVSVSQSEVGRTNAPAPMPQDYGMQQNNRKRRRSLFNPFGR